MLQQRILRAADDVRPRTDDGPSDGSLLRKYRHGDQEAANALYLRYAGRLRGLARACCSPELARRVDDEDIVQSVFGSFFRGVIHGQYNAPAGEALWNLFLAITLNKVRAKAAHHRAARRDVRRTVPIGPLADGLLSDGQAYALLTISIREALGRLPTQHAEAVRMRLGGYEVAEIAGTLGRSKRSVERILQEGRARLGELLDD